MEEAQTIAWTGLNVHPDIRGTIGRTPRVRLKRMTRGLARPLYAKLVTFNPGGSVKDRIAFPMLEACEREGSLKPGGTVVEATSGNTGVGLRSSPPGPRIPRRRLSPGQHRAAGGPVRGGPASALRHQGDRARRRTTPAGGDSHRHRCPGGPGLCEWKIRGSQETLAQPPGLAYTVARISRPMAATPEPMPSRSHCL